MNDSRSPIHEDLVKLLRRFLKTLAFSFLFVTVALVAVIFILYPSHKDAPLPLYEFPVNFDYKIMYDTSDADPDFSISKKVEASVYYHHRYHGDFNAKDTRVAVLVNAVMWLRNKFPSAEHFFVSIKMGVGDDPKKYATHIFGSAALQVNGDPEADLRNSDKFWDIFVDRHSPSEQDIEMRVFYDTRYRVDGGSRMTKFQIYGEMEHKFPGADLQNIWRPEFIRIKLSDYDEFRVKNPS